MTTPRALTETDQANAALVHIGEPALVSLDDRGRKAARECRRHFATVRDELLRETWWQFARTSVQVPPIAPPAGSSFRHRFPMPTDCIAVREVEGLHNEDWQLEASGMNEDGDIRIFIDTGALWYGQTSPIPGPFLPPAPSAFGTGVSTDPSFGPAGVAGAQSTGDLDAAFPGPGPRFLYTRRVVNPAQWDVLFAAVFQLRLAARVNPSVGRDKSLTETLNARAEQKLARAAMMDAKEAAPRRITQDTSWVSARYGIGVPGGYGPLGWVK